MHVQVLSTNQVESTIPLVAQLRVGGYLSIHMHSPMLLLTAATADQ